MPAGSGGLSIAPKYRITNERQLHRDLMQANSYARHLNAGGLGLVSLEGVWHDEEVAGADMRPIGLHRPPAEIDQTVLQFQL